MKPNALKYLNINSTRYLLLKKYGYYQLLSLTTLLKKRRILRKRLNEASQGAEENKGKVNGHPQMLEIGDIYIDGCR